MTPPCRLDGRLQAGDLHLGDQHTGDGPSDGRDDLMTVWMTSHDDIMTVWMTSHDDVMTVHSGFRATIGLILDFLKCLLFLSFIIFIDSM